MSWRILFKKETTTDFDWTFNQQYTLASRFLLEQENPPSYGRVAIAEVVNPDTKELANRQSIPAANESYNLLIKPTASNFRTLAMKGAIIEELVIPWVIKLYEFEEDDSFVSYGKTAFFLKLNNVQHVPEPEDSSLIKSVFTTSTGLGSQSFDVGHCYRIEDNYKMGNPEIARTGLDGVVCSFVGRKALLNDTIKVAIIKMF